MGTTARFLVVGMTLALAGCQTLFPSRYQPYTSQFEGGFTETEVQPGLFLVRFIGNSVTTPDRSGDFALLRGAEICLQRGKNFIHVGGVDTRYRQSGYLPGTTSTTVIPTGEPNAPIVSTVETSQPTFLYSPTSGITVSCADTNEQGAWDAQYLARSVRTKYSVKPLSASN